jgi:hypothetical protein
MKKKMTLAVMALAVSAIVGSAFAANEVPMKRIETPVQTTMATLIQAQPVMSLEQMAKEKGITTDKYTPFAAIRSPSPEN